MADTNKIELNDEEMSKVNGGTHKENQQLVALLTQKSLLTAEQISTLTSCENDPEKYASTLQDYINNAAMVKALKASSSLSATEANSFIYNGKTYNQTEILKKLGLS